MSSRVLTPANQVTILRFVFVPIFAILVLDRSYGWALAVLIATAVTDTVDGLVARVFHQETPLGVALDPIADKVLMTTAYLTLSFRDVLPWWLTILVISRDVVILMTALLISLVAGYRPFRPTLLGKISTTVQIATIFAAVSREVRVPLVSSLLVQACLYLAGIFTVASGVHYLIVVRHRYSHHAEELLPAESPEAKAEASGKQD